MSDQHSTTGGPDGRSAIGPTGDRDTAAPDDIREANIAAGKAVATAVRTTLGPNGMDKLLVRDGSYVTTNDGAKILELMEIDHPAASALVDVASSQATAVGDGTTTAVVLTGALLEHAEDLLERGIHPNTIVAGYHEAATLATEAIESQTIDAAIDKETLGQLAVTAMNGKGIGTVTARRLADLVVDAIYRVREGDHVDRESLALVSHHGASTAATQLVNGLVVTEQPLNARLSVSEFKVPRILVLDTELGVRTGSGEVGYRLERADELAAARTAEDEELLATASMIANDTTADVVFCTERVDDRIAHLLVEERVLVYDEVDDETAGQIARATNASRLGHLRDFDIDDEGQVKGIKIEPDVDGNKLTYLQGKEAKNTVTLLIRGGTRHVSDELKRVVSDAVDVVTSAVESGGIVPGAGAVELATAEFLRGRATAVDGREQLAVEAFADAVESIPEQLTASAGLDPLDSITELRHEHERQERVGVVTDGPTTTLTDPVPHGVLDSTDVKRSAIETATEVSTLLLRIDDVVPAK